MKILKSLLEAPTSSKGMKTDDEIIRFFATHAGYKELDDQYHSKVLKIVNYIKANVSQDSWKSVLNYLKRAGSYQDALYPLKQIADILGQDPSYTKGILIKNLKHGLSNLIQNGELEIKGVRAYKSSKDEK